MQYRHHCDRRRLPPVGPSDRRRCRPAWHRPSWSERPKVNAKLVKAPPSTVCVSFVPWTTNIPGVEDIEFDNVTFTGRCAVWTNEFGQARLTAYELLCAKPDAYATNEDTPLSVAA